MFCRKGTWSGKSKSFDETANEEHRRPKYFPSKPNLSSLFSGEKSRQSAQTTYNIRVPCFCSEDDPKELVQVRLSSELKLLEEEHPHNSVIHANEAGDRSLEDHHRILRLEQRLEQIDRGLDKRHEEGQEIFRESRERLSRLEAGFLDFYKLRSRVFETYYGDVWGETPAEG